MGRLYITVPSGRHRKSCTRGHPASLVGTSLQAHADRSVPRQSLQDYMERNVWPLIPPASLGRVLTREEEDQIPGYGPRATEPTGNRNGYLDSSAIVAIHLRSPCQTRPCGSAHSARNRYGFLRFGRGRHPAALKPISREHNPPRSPTMGPPAFGRHSAKSRISESCMPEKRLFDPLNLTAQLDGTSQVDTVARTVLLKLPAAS
jgi:hypothetical protein